MRAFYNDFDPHVCAWTSNLMRENLITSGGIVGGSIADVRGADLRGFNRVHFFSGIDGWEEALRLAGWGDDPVWTASCPCQPFSQAGKRRGTKDSRHLWPELRRLISECRPPVCIGEQVAGNDGLAWLAGVRADLEAMGYAVGAADLCAAGVGAPHRRQRLYWVANAQGARRRLVGTENERAANREGNAPANAGSLCDARLGVALGNAASTRLQGQWSEYRPGGEGCGGFVGLAMQAGVPEWNGRTVALRCSDGPRRASAQPGAFPVAHGLPGRVVRLRGSGNAIVPQVAAKFVRAFLEASY